MNRKDDFDEDKTVGNKTTKKLLHLLEDIEKFGLSNVNKAGGINTISKRGGTYQENPLLTELPP